MPQQTAKSAAPGSGAPGGPDAETLLEMLAQVAYAARAPGSDLDKLPARLSPSRAKDFMHCPQVFYYKTIVGLSEPGSIATTRGTLCHTAFERIFDHDASERTAELACSYLRPAWAHLTDPDLPESEFPAGSEQREQALKRAAEYRQLVPAGSDVETELLASCEQMIENWFRMERVEHCDPTGIEMPDGRIVDGRELHVAAEMFGVNLHGYIDRLDRWLDSAGNPVYAVSDYKTGRPFNEKKYAPATMDRIRWEAFFQLRVYALLCREMLGIDVRMLRLIYTKTGTRDGIAVMRVDDKVIARTREEVRVTWRKILAAARTGTWETHTGPLCNWCYFKDICPEFSTLGATPVSDVDPPALAS